MSCFRWYKSEFLVLRYFFYCRYSHCIARATLGIRGKEAVSLLLMINFFLLLFFYNISHISWRLLLALRLVLANAEVSMLCCFSLLENTCSVTRRSFPLNILSFFEVCRNLSYGTVIPGQKLRVFEILFSQTKRKKQVTVKSTQQNWNQRAPTVIDILNYESYRFHCPITQ